MKHYNQDQSIIVKSQDPTGGRKVGLSESNRVLIVHFILSKTEIMCSPGHKAVQEFVSIANDRVKSVSITGNWELQVITTNYWELQPLPYTAPKTL